MHERRGCSLWPVSRGMDGSLIFYNFDENAALFHCRDPPPRLMYNSSTRSPLELSLSCVPVPRVTRVRRGRRAGARRREKCHGYDWIFITRPCYRSRVESRPVENTPRRNSITTSPFIYVPLKLITELFLPWPGHHVRTVRTSSRDIMKLLVRSRRKACRDPRVQEQT